MTEVITPEKEADVKQTVEVDETAGLALDSAVTDAGITETGEQIHAKEAQTDLAGTGAAVSADAHPKITEPTNILTFDDYKNPEKAVLDLPGETKGEISSGSRWNTLTQKLHALRAFVLGGRKIPEQDLIPNNIIPITEVVAEKPKKVA